MDALPGGPHVIEFADSLPAEAWTTLKAVTANAPEETVEDNDLPAPGRRFYRVRMNETPP